MPLNPGTRLGPYEVLAPLGAGGMGEVYRARDTRLGREVAVKVLPAEVSGDPERLRRFEQEARAASSLNHPHILVVFDVGFHEGTSYLITELLEGDTLRERLSAGALPVARALEVATQIARGLAAAHDKGIVHRDLKPENLFLTRDGVAKVLDFGLAKLSRPEPGATPPGVADTASVTGPGVVLGTVGYMSPEQVRGETADHRSDVFAFGCVLYEMLSGRRAFRRDTAVETLSAVLKEEPPPLEGTGATLPPGLGRLVARCLEKRPEDRFQSARDLAFALREMGSDASVTPAPLPVVPVRTRPRIHPALVAVSLALAAAVIGWLSLRRAATRSGPTSDPSRLESVAVLPFAYRSTDSAKEYLGDAIAEELIDALGKVEGLRVSGRTSSFAFKGKEVDLADIGRKLGVQGVVEGSVQSEGERLRVRAELVRVAGGFQLWSQTYDRRIQDVFAVQEEIARSIAHELRPRLAAQPQASPAGRKPTDPQAYDLYLRGRQAWARRTEDSLKQAVGYFREAIGRDPEFAKAYTGLADAYSQLAAYRYAPEDEMLPLAQAAASRALALDDTLPEAHTSLAHLRASLAEWDEAERGYRRAIALNPSYATAHHWYSGLLLQQGRLDDALQEIRSAVELDPLAPTGRGLFGTGLLFRGDYQGAVSQAQRGHELAPESYGLLVVLSRIHAAAGNGPEALRTARQAVELAPQNAIARTFLARAEARFGDPRKAQEILVELERESHPCTACIVDVSIALGRTDRIPEWPTTGGRVAGWRVVFFPKVDPAYDAVRDTPAFKELLRKLKLL